MNQQQTILIAEDDENDVHLVQLALRRAGLKNPLQFVKDGQEAIDYLCGNGLYGDRVAFPFPGVVITDIKMPRKTGLEVLQWLSEHPDCSIIPSIVLSASAEPDDVLKAYQLGVSTYFRKPSKIDELTEILKAISHYWDLAVTPLLPAHC
jgi:CheY-like chemotaxis protein